ncbi:MAG: helix-turn-helix domain-containing protein [Oscillospiraceae bacterium]|nr:helix-turn-helix domain-containing protein [Oscillospiraceae bacterium]
MDKNEFGQQLAKARMAKGVTARKMSLDLDMNPSYIGRIENGHFKPSLDMLLKIQDYLQVSLDGFLDNDTASPLKVAEKTVTYARLTSDAELLEKYHKLSDENKHLVVVLIDGLSRNG